ncbi:MAG: outer membrane beta-barrel protein [Bacteroidota bacterium]
MLHQLCVPLFVLLTSFTFGQITFEPGYYLDNSGNRVEGLIRNVDWKDNPDAFSFKTNANSEAVEIGVAQAREFGVFDVFHLRYVRFTVPLDRSSDWVGDLSTKRAPEFTDEQLFLKVLVTGAASLYYYEAGNLRRFFYSKGPTEAQPLVYKRYLNQENRAAKNNAYQQELLNALPLASYGADRIARIGYTPKDLVSYFVAYNEDRQQPYENYFERNTTKKVKLHLSLRLGATGQSFVVDRPNRFTQDTDFGSTIGFRGGIELESILPFNKDKWAFFIGANYKNFDAETSFDQEGVERNGATNFEVFDIPVGVRHYFFLNSTSKIFLNGSFNTVFIPASTVELQTRSDLMVGKTTGFAFGLGYNFDNTLGVEFRYNSYQDILEFTERTSTFQGISVVAFYQIF